MKRARKNKGVRALAGRKRGKRDSSRPRRTPVKKTPRAVHRRARSPKAPSVGKPKRAVDRSKQARRGAGVKRKGARKRAPSPFVKKVKRKAAALSSVGRARLRRGHVILGWTRWRGFTSASFAALGGEIAAALRTINRKELRTITFGLRLRDPRRKIVYSETRLAVPDRRVREVARIIREKAVSESKGVRIVLERLLRGAAWRQLAEETGFAFESKGRGVVLKGKSVAAIRKMLREAHAAQGYTFSVSLNAEV